MNEMKYYVERVLHNGETGSTDYKATKQFNDINEAKKEFHNILATYINYQKLDRVSVILFDQYGNTLMHECWVKPEEETTTE